MQGQQDNVVHKVAKREEAPTRQFDSARHSSNRVNADVIADCRFCGFRHKKGTVSPFAMLMGKLATNVEAAIISEQNVILKVQMVQEDAKSASSSTEEYLHALKPKKDVERLTALLQVNNCQVRFELDTGANVNTICKNRAQRAGETML